MRLARSCPAWQAIQGFDIPQLVQLSAFLLGVACMRHVLYLAVCQPALCLGSGHNYIGTEHILLGVIGEGEGIAQRIFETLNVDKEKVTSIVAPSDLPS